MKRWLWLTEFCALVPLCPKGRFVAPKAKRPNHF